MPMPRDIVSPRESLEAAANFYEAEAKRLDTYVVEEGQRVIEAAAAATAYREKAVEYRATAERL